MKTSLCPCCKAEILMQFVPAVKMLASFDARASFVYLPKENRVEEACTVHRCHSISGSATPVTPPEPDQRQVT